MNQELLIDDSTPIEAHEAPEGCTKGLVPRNFETHPQGFYAKATAFDLPLISQQEWSERIKDMEATQSRLSDIRLRGNNGQPIPSLDQNGKGYCWAHSTTGGVMICRAIAGLPYVPLSAYAVACKIKDFQDEGGWGALSMEFAQKNGIPSQEKWPQQSMDRNHDNDGTWENAALHKVTEAWVDLSSPVYSRDLTFEQLMTLLLSRTPVVCDFNWWGHSVLALDPVEIRPGQFGIRIWNSWGDSWSDRGMGVLAGSKAIPDGAVAPRVTMASAA